MALCSYSTLLSQTTPCGQFSDYPSHFECVALEDCTKDITGHLYGKPNGAKFKKRSWLHVQQISCQGQEIFRPSSTKLSHLQQVSSQGQEIS